MDIKNKIEFEGNLWLGELEISKFNNSKEERIKAVTDIAGISKGHLGLDRCITRRKALYDRLLVESGGSPSTPFEFIPVRIKYNSFLFQDIYDTEFMNEILRYSYCIMSTENIPYLLTNMRTLLKAGIKEEDIPFNTPEELEGFKVIVGQVPIKVLNHLVRHRSFSFNIESSRNKKYLNEVKFHYPSWWNYETTIIHKQGDEGILHYAKEWLNNPNFNMKPEEATMELSDRRLVKFCMSGWKQDSATFDNLFKVRGDKTGTQNITKIVVDNIKKLCKK